MKYLKYEILIDGVKARKCSILDDFIKYNRQISISRGKNKLSVQVQGIDDNVNQNITLFLLVTLRIAGSVIDNLFFFYFYY